VYAWRGEDATTDHPAPNGSDGWTLIQERATRDALLRLKARGYTVVNLQSSGAVATFKDASIDELLKPSTAI
jgi:hypothetical protein